MNKMNVCHFQPDSLTKSGFVGSDSRSIEEIIQDDQQRLSRLDFKTPSLVQRLQQFIEEGRKGLENKVDCGKYVVQVQWDRGMLACPFGEPGLYPKMVATVRSKTTGKEIRYSALSVHLIRQHGFFGGKGSCFRLEPEELFEFLKEDKK